MSTDAGSPDVLPSVSPNSRTETASGEPPIRTRLMESLPPPNTKRWVVRRKAAVVAAVRGGGITIEEACRYYQLSEEEFLSWERALESHGLAGLRATRVQQYRAPRSRRG
jgi:transposase-like protein